MLFRNAVKPKAVDLNDPELLSWLGIEGEGRDYKGRGALREATVYACVRILSGAIGKLPLKIYQDTGTIRKASDHYLYNILKVRPNEYMSASDFFKTLETQRNLYGNAYAYIDVHKSGKDKGKIKGLYPIDASNVEIWLDSNGLYDSKNKLWYIVAAKGERIKLKSDEMLHVKGLTHTLNEVKDYLKIEAFQDEDDALIETLISASEAYLKNATGKDFSDENALAMLFCKIIIADWYENREYAAYSGYSRAGESVRSIVKSILLQLKYAD